MTNPQQLYSDVELATEVMNASKHRLVQMLYERCLQQMTFAKNAIIDKDVKRKHKTIQKASDIIHYLRSTLNLKDETTKELAGLLDLNYTFIEKCLLKATLKNDFEPLDQAHMVLATIKSGWDGIADQVNE